MTRTRLQRLLLQNLFLIVLYHNPMQKSTLRIKKLHSARNNEACQGKGQGLRGYERVQEAANMDMRRIVKDSVKYCFLKGQLRMQLDI